MTRSGSGTRAGSTWRMATALLVAITALAWLLSVSAQAKIVTAPATGHKFGILPAPRPPLAVNQAPLTRSLAAGTPTCDTHVESSCASPMTYHGGPVQHGENVILFFWDPKGFSSHATYVTDLQNWARDLAGGNFSPGDVAGGAGNPLSVTEQYYDLSGPGATKNFVPYAVGYGGTVIDTHPFPTNGCTDSYQDSYAAGQPTVTLAHCFTANQLYGELHSYIQAHNLPVGLNTEYFLLTPPGVGSCDDSSSTACAISGYCAWHTAYGSPSDPSSMVVFADTPWLAGTTCDVNRALNSVGQPSPDLYASGVDPVLTGFSHELAEIMTDPDPADPAWFGSGGGSDEIGDKCAYQYAVGLPSYDLTGLPQTAAGAFYNTTLGSRSYLLQMEYDNRAGGCNRWNTDPQPSASISAPAQVSAGSPATLSLGSVSAPSGVAYVFWYFGDGASASSGGLGSLQHTYSTPGTRAVTAVLTDNHGNEFKMTKSLTVVSAGAASLALTVSPKYPAPQGTYTVKLAGKALAGGVFGSAHNRSDLELYYQFGGTCATSWAGERARATAGSAHDAARWLVGLGAFSVSQQRQASPSPHTTVRFCGYLSRTSSLTDARATGFYTTT